MALIAGFLLLLLVSYRFAISNTLKLMAEHKKLKEEEKHFKNVPKQLKILSEKDAFYESQLKKYRINGTSLQNNILKALNSMGEENGFQVVEFREPHRFESNVIENTYIFTLEGPYNSILKGIHKLEQEHKYGEVLHLSFIKGKNYRTNTEFLRVEVLLRNFN